MRSLLLGVRTLFTALLRPTCYVLWRFALVYESYTEQLGVADSSGARVCGVKDLLVSRTCFAVAAAVHRCFRCSPPSTSRSDRPTRRPYRRGRRPCCPDVRKGRSAAAWPSPTASHSTAASLAPAASVTNVLLLHGFPEFASIYSGLMAQMASKGWRSLACNQRGYSEGASPATVDAYSYYHLADDAYAMAEAAGFTHDGGKFHLIGHDHGGFLSWFMAQPTVYGNHLHSLTSLSSPHPMPFSEALFGANADEEQVVASQYLTMFCLDDSASLHNDFWYLALGATAGSDLGFAFGDATTFQLALFWYTTVFLLDGIVAMPPVLSAEQILAVDPAAESVAALRGLFGTSVPWPSQGFAATDTVGNISVPTLFVCGTADTALLCTRPYALESADYVVDASYTYKQERNCLRVRCDQYSCVRSLAFTVNTSAHYHPHVRSSACTRQFVSTLTSTRCRLSAAVTTCSRAAAT